MTTEQENKLKRYQRGGNIAWSPDEDTFRMIVRIGRPPKNKGDDRLEPSDCAIFANGEYVALYNCELRDFVSIYRLA